MHDVRKINVMEDILDENNHIAIHTNERLTGNRILTVNEMGAPGVGKTTVLKKIIEHMGALYPYVIEGDIESDLDTQELRKMGIKTYQINTFGACHLDAPMIHNMVGNIDFDKEGILFIENIGNLVCPAEFNIGEHLKMLISSVTEGSDKPYKYPLAYEKADLIILNKVDLLPYLDFDEAFFMKGIAALNRYVPVFKVSGKTGEGFAEVAEWLSDRQKDIAHYKQHHDHCAQNQSGDHHHHDDQA